MTPKIELLYWDGCPSHPRALAELREALADVGLDPGAVEVLEVRSDDDAVRERFAGSPTIRVNGRDFADPGGEAVMLACRVYRHRDGRFAPTPDPDDLREALRGALTDANGDPGA